MQENLFISKVYHRIMLSFFPLDAVRKPEGLGASDSYVGTKGTASLKNSNNKADTEKARLKNEEGQKLCSNIFF